MWLYLLQGAGLGLSVAVAPGPLQAYLLAQSVKHGWRHTLPLILAPVVSDVPIIALVVFALTWLPEWALRGLQIVGGLVLLYVAHETYQSFKHPRPAAPPSRKETGESFVKAVAMNALSPGPYVFWSTIAGPLYLRGYAQAPELGYSFLIGFGLALVGGLAGYVFLSSSTRHLDPKYAPLVNNLTVLVLVAFGVYQVWAGLFAPASVALAH
jgi:threonine/homoserine/homoserine lactone efflux protein